MFSTMADGSIWRARAMASSALRLIDTLKPLSMSAQVSNRSSGCSFSMTKTPANSHLL